MKTRAWIAVTAALAMTVGCSKKEPETAAKPETMPETAQQEVATPTVVASGIPQVSGDTITTPSGLKYIDITVGTGAAPQGGQVVEARYTGWFPDGRVFDSGTYSFPLGGGRVIKGWDEAFATMKVGGRRLLIIPPQLAYGAQGHPGGIPPNATLVFSVELVGIQAAEGS